MSFVIFGCNPLGSIWKHSDGPSKRNGTPLTVASLDFEPLLCPRCRANSWRVPLNPPAALWKEKLLSFVFHKETGGLPRSPRNLYAHEGHACLHPGVLPMKPHYNVVPLEQGPRLSNSQKYLWGMTHRGCCLLPPEWIKVATKSYRAWLPRWEAGPLACGLRKIMEKIPSRVGLVRSEGWEDKTEDAVNKIRRINCREKKWKQLPWIKMENFLIRAKALMEGKENVVDI